MDNEKRQHLDDLISLLAETDSREDCLALLEDLCTAKELRNMAERLYAAKLLKQGMTYHQVMELADISSATLSRVSRCVQYGNGYRKLIK